MKQEYSTESEGGGYSSQYATRLKSQVEAELAKLVSELSELRLHPQIEYVVLSEGKRFRPLLLILSAESVGGSRDKVMPLALAFELIHTATLIHDDIIDQDEVRRGRVTLHRKWSVNDAILTGDALIALAVDLASEYGEHMLKTVARSALELCDGEHEDMSFSLETVSEEWYFRKILGKSASLFRAASYCGAFAAGGTPLEVHYLSEFGENFGIAYQLKDDLLDLDSSVGTIPPDLRSPRLTLPLINLYQTCGSAEKGQLKHDLQLLFGPRDSLSLAAAGRIQRILGEAGSMTYCEEKVLEYVRKSIESIRFLKNSNSKSCLVKMAESLIG